MNLADMTLTFEIRKLNEKLKYGAELVNRLDKMIRDLDLSNDDNKRIIRDMCSDIEMFLGMK